MNLRYLSAGREWDTLREGSSRFLRRLRRRLLRRLRRRLHRFGRRAASAAASSRAASSFAASNVTPLANPRVGVRGLASFNARTALAAASTAARASASASSRAPGARWANRRRRRRQPRRQRRRRKVNCGSEIPDAIIDGFGHHRAPQIVGGEDGVAEVRGELEETRAQGVALEPEGGEIDDDLVLAGGVLLDNDEEGKLGLPQ